MKNSPDLKQKLFLVVLGGRVKGCHIEVHDVRWVVGETIKDTISELKKQWWGLKKGLHIDSYREIKEVDGYNINICSTVPTERATLTSVKLWFVNIGAYEKNKMAEQHEYGLVVANTSFSAKAKAKKKWLHGLEKQHKDDLDGRFSRNSIERGRNRGINSRRREGAAGRSRNSSGAAAADAQFRSSRRRGTRNGGSARP